MLEAEIDKKTKVKYEKIIFLSMKIYQFFFIFVKVLAATHFHFVETNC